MLNKKASTIELLAGVVSLVLGIEKTGFDTLDSIEFDKDAAIHRKQDILQ